MRNKPIENLRALIEDIIYNGKFPQKVKPFMVDVLIDIYNHLLHGEKPNFISQDLIPVLHKCGIKTNETGIGWEAYL